MRKWYTQLYLNTTQVYRRNAVFDTPDNVPGHINNNNKHYTGLDGCTILKVTTVAEDCGKINILVLSLVNNPEATKPLLETSHKG